MQIYLEPANVAPCVDAFLLLEHANVAPVFYRGEGRGMDGKVVIEHYGRGRERHCLRFDEFQRKQQEEEESSKRSSFLYKQKVSCFGPTYYATKESKQTLASLACRKMDGSLSDLLCVVHRNFWTWCWDI